MKCIMIALIISIGTVAEAKTQGIQVDVVNMLISNGKYVVILKTTEGDQFLPIWIGDAEALNVSLRVSRQKAPRPLTLDLLESVLKVNGIKVVEARINDLHDDIFLGELILEQNGKRQALDARPSDIIGLALSSKAPIFVSKSVLDKASVSGEEANRKREDKSLSDRQNHEETL